MPGVLLPRRPLPSLNRRIGYGWLITNIVKEFDALPLRDIPRKPRVGLVGEILVKFHPDANNNAVGVIEAEGCEAVLPGIMEFFMMPLYSSQYQWDTLGIGRKSHHVKKAVMWMMRQYQEPANAALRKTKGKFHVHRDVYELADKASEVISMGTRAGEGWLLTAEMMDSSSRARLTSSAHSRLPACPIT